MRDLLFLAHRIPYPPNKGDKIRAWHFLRHLAARRPVYLGCFIDDDHDWAHVALLKELCREANFIPLQRARALARSVRALATRQALTVPYYRDRRMREWVRLLQAKRPMTTFVFSSSMAQYAMDDRRCARIVDFVDVDSQKWCEYSQRNRWPTSAVYRRECKALLSAERRICLEFDASVFVSDAEADLFKRLAPECAERVFTVSMGVDCDQLSPLRDYPDPYAGLGRDVLCFTGMMDYWPNADAVAWFVDAVLPAVRRTRPSTTFWIVGANPTRDVRRLGQLPGVTVTGRVPDVRPYLAHAAAVVAPLRVARGTQSKVLEAMAMARPVVCSGPAFEGLRVRPGRDLIVADRAEDFAAGIEAALDPTVGAAFGTRAREAVQALYVWPEQLARLDALLDRVETSRLRKDSATERLLMVCP